MIAMSKPAYLAISKDITGGHGALFAGRDENDNRLEGGILLHASADVDEKRFLNIEESELQRQSEHETDREVAENMQQ